jgi:hypothetical protein
VNEIPDDLVDELSTPYPPLEREITNQVARSDDQSDRNACYEHS